MSNNALTNVQMDISVKIVLHVKINVRHVQLIKLVQVAILITFWNRILVILNVLQYMIQLNGNAQTHVMVCNLGFIAILNAQLALISREINVYRHVLMDFIT